MRVGLLKYGLSAKYPARRHFPKAKALKPAYDVVIVGSPNVNDGYKLVNNPAYSQIAADYERMFKVLRSLHCDVFLGAHGGYYEMEAKYARIKAGAANPFIDPEGYSAYINDREQAFRTELAKQRAAGAAKSSGTQ